MNEWCICDSQGTCWGCLIEAKVKEDFGELGYEKLRLIIRKSEMYDETVKDDIEHIIYATPRSKEWIEKKYGI